MGSAFDTALPVFGVFVQGLLSFFSPCVLPLLPFYMGYLSGGTLGTDAEGRTVYDRKKILVNTLFFVIGISFAIFLLGLGMTAVGSFFTKNQALFAKIGGVIIILFGLYQLGVFGTSRLLSSERRLPLPIDKMTLSPVTALLLGFVISFAWTPCVGPMLSGVLIMAMSAASRAKGFLLIGVYTLGYVIPFLLAGLFTGQLLTFFGKHRSVVRYTAKIGGALMLILGILMFAGKLNGTNGSVPVSPEREEAAEDGNVPDSGTAEGADSAAEQESSAQGDAGSDTASDAADDAADAAESNSKDGGESSAADGAESDTGDAAEGSSAEDTEDSSADENAAPDFELVDQYGNTHRLSDYRGKLIFLNCWATWCPPCRSEMPDIQKLYEEYAAMEDPDVVILGVAFPNISGETNADGVAAFLEENEYTFPVVMDTEGTVLYNYGISAFPTTFFIAPDGTVLGYVPGAMTESSMREMIARAKSMI